MERLRWPEEKKPSEAKRSKHSTVSGQFGSVSATPMKAETRGAGHAEKLTTLGASFVGISSAADTGLPDGTRTIAGPNAQPAIGLTKAANGSSDATSTGSNPEQPSPYTSEAGDRSRLTPMSFMFGPDYWPSGTRDWSPESKLRMDTATLVQIQRLRRERHEAIAEGRSARAASLSKQLYELTGKPGYQ